MDNDVFADARSKFETGDSIQGCQTFSNPHLFS